MSKLKYFILFLVMWSTYFFINYTNATRQAFNLSISLDNLIPLIPEFIFFYILYFPLILIPFLIIKDNKNFLKIVKANIFIIVISDLFFILLPARIIRPELIVDNFSSYILNLIYVLDKPVNLFPSLHVSMTFLAFLIISKFKKDLRIIILIAFILSALSTLFIKQHYLLDTLAGLVLGFISYKIYFKK